MNLPIDEKLLKAADDLEEKIIKEEILPSLSQNIEPLLNEIQRNLVLVVEYHPGDPISVALSRKVKISDFTDAKPLTPPSAQDETDISSQPVSVGRVDVAPHEPTKHVENPTKGLRVTFPDGTVIWHKAAIDTLIETLSKIGFDKVMTVDDIFHAGFHLVSKKMRPTEAGKTWQHKVGDLYIYSNTNNAQKISDLKKISNALNLALTIEEIKPTK